MTPADKAHLNNLVSDRGMITVIAKAIRLTESMVESVASVRVPV